MIEWRVWKTPELKQFNSPVDFEDYIERSRCGVCHKKMQDGEEFELKAIEQTLEERKKFHGSEFNAICVIVHRKCIE